MKNKIKILIIGTGSIAKRHAKNTIKIFNKKKYDCEIFIFSKKIDRATKFSRNLTVKNFIIKKKNNIKNIKFDYVLIASDISSHIEWLKFFKKDKLKIFCEKPLVVEKKDINWLEKNKSYFKKVFIGFQYRFDPVTIKLKNILRKKLFGKLLSTSFEIGQDIKDWRKGNDFRNEFAFGKTNKNKRSVIWELCHDVDLMFYLIGSPSKIFTQESKVKYKKINTKDFAHLIGTYKDNSKLIISQNMFSPSLYKKLNLIFEKKLVEADFVNRKIELSSKNKKKKIVFKKDRNIPFIKELESFFVKKKNDITIQDGLRVSKFIANSQINIK